ncbi:MAG: hypothetical protein ACLU9T_14725 [Blautia faecis]
MKKILCFTLAFLLCLSSVCTAYASSTDSDHGGTGGSLGGNHGGTGGSIDWETLEPVDHSDFDKVIGTLGFLMHPDSAVANAGLTLANLLGLDDLDDDTKTYINDNIMDNTRTDGDNYYFNQNFVQNINQKVQSRVHALNGYYLIDSVGDFSKDNVVYWLDKLYKFDLLSYLARSENNLNQFNTNFSKFNFAFIANMPDNQAWTFISSKLGSSVGSSVFWFVDSDNNIKLFDANSSQILKDYSIYSTCDFVTILSWNSIQSASSHIFVCLGVPQKIFYSLKDVNSYINQGQQYYSPNLPNKTIKIPINYINAAPKLNLDFDISGKLADEIQGQLDLNFNAWLDKLAEINVNPSNPTPTPGSSGGGSGGDHGGTGGDFGKPTPTPDPDGGFTSGTYDLLDQIYKWLVSFGEKHDIFAKKITDYIEANDGKLDQIIEAINALGNGKTETENNGCKYDFTVLSDFMTKLWNESDKKFDNMVSLLEENNKYQQKLVNFLNEIKAILVTQTVLELFQDRSSETANKAKDKFPTSLPWDIAMVVNAMAAEPQEIKIDLPIEIQSLGIHEEINIDLSSGAWEKLAKTCRYLLSILFILFMIHLSRKMFFNGGDD